MLVRVVAQRPITDGISVVLVEIKWLNVETYLLSEVLDSKSREKSSQPAKRLLLHEDIIASQGTFSNQETVLAENGFKRSLFT